MKLWESFAGTGGQRIGLVALEKQCGGMKPDEVKWLKELEFGNRRIKEMLVEAGLDKRILKEVVEGNC